MKLTFSTLIVLGLTMSCAPVDHTSSVGDVIKSSDRHDGRQIVVRGVMSSRDGFLNLFSGDRKECIGLLLTSAERATYFKFAERKVSVSGTFRSQGCGRDGICDEHLCGPGVLTDVTIRQLSY